MKEILMKQDDKGIYKPIIISDKIIYNRDCEESINYDNKGKLINKIV